MCSKESATQPLRICIFVHFDDANVVAPCVERYLAHLYDHCGEIVVVSNCQLPISEQDKLSHFASEILLRENRGMDFGAWKDAIGQVGWKHLRTFDELILANDSCYAPMFPFEDMFETMSKRGADFWGITEHPAGSTGSGQLDAHLQSYFLVFTTTVVSHQAFKLFWKNVSNEQTDYNAVIRNCESELTPALNKAGFTHSAFIKDSDFSTDTGRDWNNPRFVNRTIWSWSELLKNKSPFLKRRAIPFHLDRTSKLIRIGYGKKVTTTAYRQTFFWRRCIKSSKSSFPIEIISHELESKNGAWHSFQLINWLMFYLFWPYRVFKKIRHTIKG